jgi:hypothetical protein
VAFYRRPTGRAEHGRGATYAGAGVFGKLRGGGERRLEVSWRSGENSGELRKARVSSQALQESSRALWPYGNGGAEAIYGDGDATTAK